MMNQAKQKLANAMTFSEYKYHILADAYRITAKLSMIVLVKLLFFGGSFKYIFWMRTCSFLKTNRYLKYVLYPIALLALRRLTYKFGISIPAETKIGPGLYIGHFGGIVVNSRTVIGKNFTVSQGVTLGKANRGKKQGYPNVGDNV